MIFSPLKNFIWELALFYQNQLIKALQAGSWSTLAGTGRTDTSSLAKNRPLGVSRTGSIRTELETQFLGHSRRCRLPKQCGNPKEKMNDAGCGGDCGDGRSDPVAHASSRINGCKISE
jgi:hypothetical protein